MNTNVRSAAIEAFWLALRQARGVAPDQRCDVFAFGDSAATADELLALVLAGPKRATAALVLDFERSGDPLPERGSYSLVLDGHGAPGVHHQDDRGRGPPVRSGRYRFRLGRRRGRPYARGMARRESALCHAPVRRLGHGIRRAHARGARALRAGLAGAAGGQLTVGLGPTWGHAYAESSPRGPIVADLKVRNLDDAVASALKARAKAKGISLEEEMRQTLTASVAGDREALVARAKALHAAAGCKPASLSSRARAPYARIGMPGADFDLGVAVADASVVVRWVVPERGRPRRWSCSPGRSTGSRPA
jgi:plasmid stability protein